MRDHTPELSAGGALFHPDLSSPEAIVAQGGSLPATWEYKAAASAHYQFGPGRRGPAVRGPEGGWAYVLFPSDGLIPFDDFAVDLSFRADRPWGAMFSGRAFFSIVAGNVLEVFPGRDGLEIRAGRKLRRILRIPGEKVDDQKWHSLRLIWRARRLRVDLDGELAGTLDGVDWRPLWSDTTHSDGFRIAGAPGSNGPGFWVSDITVRRLAGGEDGELRVAARTTLRRLPERFLGGLHPSNNDPGMARLALEMIRTDKILSATPIQRGGPDAAHPSPGRSGRFSYDWQVCDRTLDWFAREGMALYLSVDATPQLLGGSVPPLAGDALRTHLSYASRFGPKPPNNLADWAAIVEDLAHHILNERKRPVLYWGVWNEPESRGSFWEAGLDPYLDLYAATVRAIRRVDPRATVGGPEVALYSHKEGDRPWIRALIERCARDRLPLDFISFHDYAGTLNGVADADEAIGEWVRAAGLPTAPRLLVGEMNWASENAYKTGKHNFRDGMWHLRAFGAAYLMAYCIQAARNPRVDAVVVTRTAGPDPRQGGWNSVQLLGPRGERWAPFNALAGWKKVVGPELLSTAGALPPGIFALASRGAGSSETLGLVLVNYGFAQRRSRRVRVRLEEIRSGRYRSTVWRVDPTHSSRWDRAEDRAEGARDDELAQIESQTVAADAGGLTLSWELPPWSCTFVRLDPA